MAETTTETAQNQTEAATSTQTSTVTESKTGAEAAATLLVTEGEQKQATGEQKQETSTETETEAAKPEEKSETKTETKTEGAPEKYEFKDADKFDSKVLEAFSVSAKEANLTQDAAQKLLEKMAPELAARHQEQVDSIYKQWVDESTSDKEFGGEKLKENLGIAKRGLDSLDPIPQGQKTTPLRTFLEESKLGNHREIIRLLFRAGKLNSEDTFVGGQHSTTQSPETVLYPTMVKK